MTYDPTPETLDAVGSLVDKSLLRQAEGPDGEPRFGMLETIREYAAERFEARGDAETWRQRHAEYYLALAEQAAPELVGPRQSSWLERLEREHDNLRAALGWAIEGGDEALGLRLATALGRFWSMRGHLGEGLAWIERAISRWPDAPAPARAEALSAAGNLAHAKGAYDRAATLHNESLSVRRALGDRRGAAESLHTLGMVALYQGELDRAAAPLDESLAIWRALGNTRSAAMVLNTLGVLARNRGEHMSAHVPCTRRAWRCSATSATTGAPAWCSTTWRASRATSRIGIGWRSSAPRAWLSSRVSGTGTVSPGG